MAASTRCLACAAVLVAAACGGDRDGASSTDSPAVAAASPATLELSPDRTFTRDGVVINYRVIGTGDPLLLIHGYGDNLMMWVGTADSLARDHRVIAVDTRGFGKSGKPAGETSYGTAMIDDLTALLDHLDIRQVHVVGYSMGAMLASRLALSHPERVRTATMAAGTYAPDTVALRTLVTPWLDDLEHGRRLTRLLKQIVPVLSDSLARSYSDQLFAEGDSAAYVGVMRGFVPLSVDWARVAESRVPAVVIVGMDDPLRPYSPALAAKWPGAKLVELPATDHMTIFTARQLIDEVRALTKANPIAVQP